MDVLSWKSSWGCGGVETVEALRSEGAPLSAALLTSFRFIDFELSSKNRQEKAIKFTLQNSFVHDTDNHYFDVRQTHDTRMEYVQKTGRHGMFTTVCVN